MTITPGQTVNRKYRYPGQGLEPDVAGDMQKLAEDVDVDVQKIATDVANNGAMVETKLVLTNNATVFVETDASAVPYLTRSGKVVELSGRVIRTSGTGTVVGVVPLALRPPRGRFWTEGSLNPSSTDGPRFHVSINPATGEIVLAPLANSPAWGTSTWIPLRGTWLIP